MEGLLGLSAAVVVQVSDLVGGTSVDDVLSLGVHHNTLPSVHISLLPLRTPLRTSSLKLLGINTLSVEGHGVRVQLRRHFLGRSAHVVFVVLELVDAGADEGTSCCDRAF